MAKVIFLHLFVILFTGGVGSASMHAGIPPPPDQADPPGTRQTPLIRHPPGTRQTPSPIRHHQLPGSDTPPDQTPPGTRQTSPDQTPPPPRRGPGRPPRIRHTPPLGPGRPPGSDTTPPDQTPPPRSDIPPGSRLQHTVYERPVRILLECILVYQNGNFLSHPYL